MTHKVTGHRALDATCGSTARSTVAVDMAIGRGCSGPASTRVLARVAYKD